MIEGYRNFVVKHFWRQKKHLLKRKIVKNIKRGYTIDQDIWIYNFLLLFDGAKEWQIWYHEKAWRGFSSDLVEEIRMSESGEITYEAL